MKGLCLAGQRPQGVRLEYNPQAIRIMARENPAALGFPVVVIGTRTKIPRVPFLRYVLGDK